MFDHEVGSDDSGRSADSGVTVDQHFTAGSERFVNELGGGLEIATQVKGVRVEGRNAQEFDAHVPVIRLQHETIRRMNETLRNSKILTNEWTDPGSADESAEIAPVLELWVVRRRVDVHGGRLSHVDHVSHAQLAQLVGTQSRRPTRNKKELN